jgi:hypothetical protein
VVGCLGGRAGGHEGDAMAPLADRARFGLESCADQGVAAERVRGTMPERGIEAFAPPKRTLLSTDTSASRCPARGASGARALQDGA